jgi:hypothetical protein
MGRLARREVLVQRADAGARAPGDAGGGGAVRPALAQKRSGRLDDGLDGGARPRLTR